MCSPLIFSANTYGQQCVISDCAYLGYTETSDKGGCLKCPFGDYWFCPAAERENCDSMYAFPCNRSNEYTPHLQHHIMRVVTEDISNVVVEIVQLGIKISYLAVVIQIHINIPVPEHMKFLHIHQISVKVNILIVRVMMNVMGGQNEQKLVLLKEINNII